MMKSFISAFVILFASFSFWGQSISVHADTNAIALGEQTKVKWLLTYRVDNGEVNIQLPKVKEVFSGAVELIEAQPIDTTVDKNDIAQFTLSQELVITSFEIGEQKLPELEFVYNDSTIKSYPLPNLVLVINPINIKN